MNNIHSATDAPRHRVALVTGASSGIGEALAAALAARGTHVVLVARTRDRLEALASRIEGSGGRATVLPADLAAPGAAGRIHDEVERIGLNIDLLVNNAGFGHYGAFEAQEPQRLADMLQVNVVALTELTRRFVPGLVEGQGAILNVASTAGLQPTPYMSAYGATKAYILQFSEALWAEYRGRGLHVVAVCPGPARPRSSTRRARRPATRGCSATCSEWTTWCATASPRSTGDPRRGSSGCRTGSWPRRPDSRRVD